MVTLPVSGPETVTKSASSVKSGNNSQGNPITLRDAQQLAGGPSASDRSGRTSHFATATNRATPAVPSGDQEIYPALHIPYRSKHYSYALLINEGYCNQEACDIVGVSPRTAEEWRSDLRKAAASIFGRQVEYHFAVRHALQSMCASGADRAAFGRVRTPHAIR